MFKLITVVLKHCPIIFDLNLLGVILMYRFRFCLTQVSTITTIPT